MNLTGRLKHTFAKNRDRTNGLAKIQDVAVHPHCIDSPYRHTSGDASNAGLPLQKHLHVVGVVIRQHDGPIMLLIPSTGQLQYSFEVQEIPNFMEAQSD